MMLSVRDLLSLIDGLTVNEVEHWVAVGWVCPVEETNEPRFRDIDVARVRLIHELRHDFEINEAGLGVVLNLLDQLHALRRDASLLERALHTQPENIRAAIAQAIGKISDK